MPLLVSPEALRALVPTQRAQLFMPRLGGAVEPAQKHALLPRRRGVDVLPGIDYPDRWE